MRRGTGRLAAARHRRHVLRAEKATVPRNNGKEIVVLEGRVGKPAPPRFSNVFKIPRGKRAATQIVSCNIGRKRAANEDRRRGRVGDAHVLLSLVRFSFRMTGGVPEIHWKTPAEDKPTAARAKHPTEPPRWRRPLPRDHEGKPLRGWGNLSNHHGKPARRGRKPTTEGGKRGEPRRSPPAKLCRKDLLSSPAPVRLPLVPGPPSVGPVATRPPPFHQNETAWVGTTAGGR